MQHLGDTMENFNFHALWGVLFGTVFLLNGLWEKSPFVLPYFKRIQEERLGAKGFKSRMILTGVVLLGMSCLYFFNVIT
jgi:hypothetical protein